MIRSLKRQHPYKLSVLMKLRTWLTTTSQTQKDKYYVIYTWSPKMEKAQS